MRKYFYIFIFSILAFILWQCSNPVSSPIQINKNITASDKQLVQSSRLFGLKLFKQVNQSAGDTNIFISPISISTALGMVLNGANGKTYDEIKSTLELPGNTQEEINKSYKNLNNLLTQIDPKVIFESANSIWYRQDVSFEQSFLNINKTYFDAEVQALNFADPSAVNTINNWVSEKTKQKITGIIDRIPQDAVMYLINAIYFKGTWLYKFDSTATKDDNFYVTSGNPVICKMMDQKNKFNYYKAVNYQAVELPYGDGDFEMLVILPSSGTDINSLINQMDDSYWNNLLANMDSADVNLWLPKFKIEYSITLNDALKALGMTSAFDSTTADFSNIRKEKDLFISRVLHKTYVKVDEEGTEAAGVTAVEFTRSSVSPGNNEVYMKINRPFIFAIRENSSGAILFVGKVVNPDQ
jgi:serpin B